MKRALFLFSFLLSAFCFSATLTVPVADLTQGNVNNRRLTLTSTDSPRQSGAALITVEPKTQFTDSNGTTTFTNVLWGNYRLDIAGTPGTAFRFFVPDTNATISVLTLITNHTAPNPATNFWTAAQTAAAIAAGGGGSGSNFNIILVTNSLTLGTGSNAVTWTSEGTPDGSLSVSNLIASGTITGPMHGTNIIAATIETNQMSAAAHALYIDGDTITGITQNSEVIVFQTNNVVISGTNRLWFGLFTNFVRAEITLPYTNVFTAGSIPPLPDYRLETSTNGTDWESGLETTTNSVYVSLYDANAASAAGFATAITIWGYSDETTFGTVIDLAGQDLQVDTLTNSRSVVNLSLSQTVASGIAYTNAAAWATHTATARPQLAALGLGFDNKWTATHSTGTNESSLALSVWGTRLLTLTANDVTTPANAGKTYLSSFVVSGTNITATVLASNVVAALVPQFVTNNASATNWADVASYTSSYPFTTNGQYTLGWGKPTWTNDTFYRIKMVTNGTYTAVRSVTASGTFAATNGVIHPSLSAAPTLAQIGATNVWFTWASNGTPPLLVGSYYNAASNIVSKTLAP